MFNNALVLLVREATRVHKAGKMIIALFNFNMVGFSMFLKGQVVPWEKVDV